MGRQATSDTKTEAEGEAEQLKGKARNGLVSAKDVVGDKYFAFAGTRGRPTGRQRGSRHTGMLAKRTAGEPRAVRRTGG